MADPSILVGGEVLVDLLGSADRLADATSFERHAGGAPANVAIGLTELGVAPHLWTTTGGDPFGEFLRTRLQAHGIPDRFVMTLPDRQTALAFVSDGGDEPEFTVYHEGTATVALDPTTVPTDFLQECDWVHVGGTLLAVEPARSALLELLGRAADHDCLVSFDPNTRPDLWGSETACREVLREAFAHVDVATVSPRDVRPLSEISDSPADIADDLCSLGPSTVCVTLGDEGVYAQATADAPWGPTSVRTPGHRVSVVDETGAGDAFTAAIIAELVDTEDPVDLDSAVAFANAAGALATTREGALGRLPSQGEIDAFLGAGSE